MSVQWNGDSVFRAIRGRLSHNVEASLRHLANSVRNNLYVPFPPPSSPGEPPHRRTGQLLGSVDYTFSPALLTGSVEVTAPYAVHLEYGTVNMAARPFFRSTIAQEQGVVMLLLGSP